ncbi:tripartite motif-containing protein 29-like [Clupea harengus]|uniref:Tripartite motif-containing protein 29-like n=1 Tax=Clupea harengus TaxID=7950 RepID=A0A6P8ETE3_CLUHA|nr:tripartite motif-containing protein 29-like [Clupea harengus]
MRCIEGCWDQEDQRGVYSCSLCKHTFTPRPTLYKNTLVAEMVETFRKTRIQAFPITPSDDGPGHVECDVCTGRKLKAVKSCLDCLLSYCETHLKVHNDVNPGRKHSVIDAMGQLQERICSHHKKFLEIFCRTDQSLICYLCKLDEHRGHDTVSAAAERTDKQRQLGQTQEVVRISAAVTNIQIIKSLEYADPELPVRRTSSKENLPPSSKSLLTDSNSL